MSHIAHFLRNYLHPYQLIEDLADTTWPYAEPFLNDLKHERFLILEKLFNLVALITIHYTFKYLDWIAFFHFVLLLGVFKRICQKHEDKLSSEKSNVVKKSKDDKNKNFDYGSRVNKKGVVFDADRVEDFCKNNLKPSLNWLNLIIRTIWLNFRALAKFKLLREIWPDIKESLADGPMATLEIYDFNIGDKPFQILSIDCIDYSTKHLIIDAEITYDGNANIAITYAHQSLNISIPVTLHKFSVSNVKVRIVLKNIKDTLPLVEGIQFFFLESPVIDWETADAARVVDMPLLDNLIKNIIDEQVIQRFVLPNRVSIPVKLPNEALDSLRGMGLTVVNPTDASVVMPDPEGVVRVTVVKAENLRPTDLGFSHYSTSENLNPCKPSKFACSQLLPKKSSGDPYVTVSVGKERYQSETVRGNLNPSWNFTCEFVIEYYHKALVKLELYDSDYSFGGINSDDLLGRISEKISRIRKRAFIEGWYNCQVYQGRAHLKLEWIALDHKPTSKIYETDDTPVSGALCLFMGTIRSKEMIRPVVYMTVMNNDEVLKEHRSLDALALSAETVINEGKIFRLANINDRELTLQIKVYDGKTEAFVAMRKFNVKAMMQQRLEGNFKLYNSFDDYNPTRSVVISMESKIVYDQVPLKTDVHN